jgi:hypothetical protein
VATSKYTCAHGVAAIGGVHVAFEVHAFHHAGVELARAFAHLGQRTGLQEDHRALGAEPDLAGLQARIAAHHVHLRAADHRDDVLLLFDGGLAAGEGDHVAALEGGRSLRRHAHAGLRGAIRGGHFRHGIAANDQRLFRRRLGRVHARLSRQRGRACRDALQI